MGLPGTPPFIAFSEVWSQTWRCWLSSSEPQFSLPESDNDSTHLTGCKAKWDDPAKGRARGWAGSTPSLTGFFPFFSYMSPLLPSQVHPTSLLSIKHRKRCFLFRTPLLRPERSEPSVRSMSRGVRELPAKAGSPAPNNVPLCPAYIEQGCAQNCVCPCIVHHVTVRKKFPRWPIHSSKWYFLCVCNPAAWWLIRRQKILHPHHKHKIVALGLIFSTSVVAMSFEPRHCFWYSKRQKYSHNTKQSHYTYRHLLFFFCLKEWNRNYLNTSLWQPTLIPR